jgi:4-amino-4-deoxy-L-arabinose transferase-like glycosyltransferase
LFHEGLGLLKPAAAFRLPAFAVAALIPALIYLLGTSLYDRKVGLWGAISFLLVPRQFFNAHLACFDVPIAAMWLLTVYLFWRAPERPRGWLWCGLAFGLTLATKHNGWFLPLVLTPFALWRGWQTTRASPEGRALLYQLVALYAGVGSLFLVMFASLGPDRFLQKIDPLSPATALAAVLIAGSIFLLRRLAKASEPAFRAMATMVAMALIGPAIFYLLWPYLWHHPVGRAAWYFEFHATHNHYAWFYLGELLRRPPFPLEYVVVKTALTVPTAIFLPMVLGLAALALRCVLSPWAHLRRIAELPRFGEVLTAVNAIVPILIISHPSVPHFGGVKHWLAAMPFLAVLGGRSVSRASD